MKLSVYILNPLPFESVQYTEYVSNEAGREDARRICEYGYETEDGKIIYPAHRIARVEMEPE